VSSYGTVSGNTGIELANRRREGIVNFNVCHLSPQPQPNVIPDTSGIEYSVRFWIGVILTGLAAGIVGGLLMQLLFLVEHTAWSYQTPIVFLQAVSRASASRRVLNLLLAGIVVGVAGSLLRRAFGSAGGDVDGAIWARFGKMEFVPTIAKAIVSIIAVGLGMSLGRESPIKQAGGALASKFSEWCRLSRSQQQLLVACGVGAGMASAYNVPLGGAMFAVEVLIGSMSVRKVLPALVTSAVATAASWTLLPIKPVYFVPEFAMSFQVLVWAIVFGPVLGIAGVVVVRALAWSEARHPRGWAAIVAPILVMTALGALAIAFPQLLGNGKDTVQLAFDDSVSLRLLLLLPILKLIATAGCLRSGGSGGLFTPTMAVGALLGGLLGHAWSMLWPGGPPGSYAVAGAAAVLAAATRGPVSSLVLVLELTRHIDATMVPILLAVCGATWVAGMVESRSIYSARAESSASNGKV
jgi:H+/Cl- antiporter ClcA